MNGDLVVYIVPETAISDEELAAAAHDLRDDLNEVRGVDAEELTGPPQEGTRDSGSVVLGAITLSLFALPTAIRLKADLKHLADIIQRYQERHRGKRLQIALPDGTHIDAENVSESKLAELLKNVPRQQPTGPAEQRKSVD